MHEQSHIIYYSYYLGRNYKQSFEADNSCLLFLLFLFQPFLFVLFVLTQRRLQVLGVHHLRNLENRTSQITDLVIRFA